MHLEPRQEKIKFLRRQEDRTKRLPILLADLSRLIERPISEEEVLSIGQIDEHQAQLNATDFDFNFINISFPENKTNELVKLLSNLKDQLARMNYFALSHFSDIAIVNLETSFVLQNIEEIIKLDGDTFTVYDHGYKNGLWIDLFQEFWYLENKTERINIYELRVFGTDWIKQIVSGL
jgi:hypothetical protein